MQHVNFALSQLQPKRCAIHHYIARNILHQQFTKMNPLLPVAISSGSLRGTKPSNVNSVPSAESLVVSKQSQKHLSSVDQNCAQEKGLTVTSNPSLTATKSSNNAKSMDSTHRMQFVLQQGPHPGSNGNLVVWSCHLIASIHLKTWAYFLIALMGLFWKVMCFNFECSMVLLFYFLRPSIKHQ